MYRLSRIRLCLRVLLEVSEGKRPKEPIYGDRPGYQDRRRKKGKMSPLTMNAGVTKKTPQIKSTSVSFPAEGMEAPTALARAELIRDLNPTVPASVLRRIGPLEEMV